MWSGTAILAAALWLGGEAEPPVAAAHDPELRKCKPCLAALGRSMGYLKENFDNPQTKRVIGSMLGGYVYAGFAFMMAGEGYSKELDACVRWCQQAVKDTGFNRNWYLGSCLYFLAEHAQRFGLTPQTRKAVLEAYKLAAEQQEESGGWCHHKEMWKKDDYNKKGGGRDLGMINVQMFAALTEFKALGIDPGPMLDKLRKNLESISDGPKGGICYGTDNRVGDPAFGRAAYVQLGLQSVGAEDDAFFARYAEGLQKNFRRIKEGEHGFAPYHYFGVPAALHRMGPAAYRPFCEEWLDKLIETQRPDGVVPLHGEDDVASTGVFACIVWMQKEGVFKVPPKRKPKP
jgi:hypothetical protein